MDPIYPDILDQYIGKVYECHGMPLIIKENMITSISHPCDTAARRQNSYYSPPDGGIKIASEPRDTYIVISTHVENHIDRDRVITPGIRILHTGHLRKNDLNMIIVGATNNEGNLGTVGIMIPPYEPRFVIRSIIDMNCFKDVIIVQNIIKLYLISLSKSYL